MKEWFTVQEAAEYLGYSAYSLQLWRIKGGGPCFHKPIRRVFYKKADLDAWMEGTGRRRHTSTPATVPVPKATGLPRVQFTAEGLRWLRESIAS